MKRFVIRIGKKGKNAIEKWSTMFVDEGWFKMGTDYLIAREIRKMYQEAKKEEKVK
jgi:hypothetical protein